VKALALLAALLLSGCAALQPAPSDAAGRLALIDTVWTAIDSRHVDPAPPDWATARERHREAVLNAPAEPDPEALWLALDRVAGERRDAHTRVEGPREVRRKTHDSGPSLGLSLSLLEGEWVADKVLPDGPAARAGVRPGMRLLRWNGRAPEALWAERLAQARHSSTERARDITALRQWLDGPPGSRVQLEWQGQDGAPLPMTLSRAEQALPPRWSFELRPGGVAVLRWNRFDLRIEAALRETLLSLPTLRGLVLDLRSNGGGSFDMTKRLLDLLLPTEQVVQFTHLRGGQRRVVHRAGGAAGAYAGPLLVLVDRASGSGSEMLAGTLQQAGRAEVLGETSCGCLLGIDRYLPLSAGARLAISERALTLADGRRVEGVGLRPDVEVPRTLAALRAGRDEVLERAEQRLLRNAP